MSLLCQFFYSALIMVMVVLYVSLPSAADEKDVIFNVAAGENSTQQIFNHEANANQLRDINISSNVSSCLLNLQQRDYLATVSSCNSLLKTDPHNANAQLNLGLAYYNLGQYSKAISQYNFIIAENDQDYRAYYNRGLVYTARQQYLKAITDYTHSLAVSEASDPKPKAIIYNDLGVAYTMLGDYQQAIANLDLAIAIQPDQFGAYFNRGCANHRQGNYQQGIEDFSQVIALRPNYTEAYISRSILHHLLHHERLAYSDLDLALQQNQAQDEDLLPAILKLKQTMIKTQANRLG